MWAVTSLFFLIYPALAATMKAGERLGTPSVARSPRDRESGRLEASKKDSDLRFPKREVYILTQNQYSYSRYQEVPNNAAGVNAGARAPSGPPPRQPTGLLKQASSASIGVLFGILAWRSLTAYEMADSFRNGFVKTVSVAPTLGLLVLNVIGFVVNWIRPLNFKNYLKFILSVNIMREWVELAYNLLMILLTDSSSVIPREVYFGRVFMNLWMTALQMAFAKSRWVSTEVFKTQLERHQRQIQEQLAQQYTAQQQHPAQAYSTSE
jgi:hypothetical protein